MKIDIITIGDKLPNWANEAVFDYQKRFHSMADFSLSIKAIAPKKRTKTANISNIVAAESAALIAAIPNHYHAIALDVAGQQMSSEALATQLDNYHSQGDNLAILIGGPDGFDDTVRQRVDGRWSVSRLTLPHPLVRVLIVETLYRSVSILHQHPYHRASTMR
ncbi:23S rRNA (pseudouridine(1915)-N(3))-methyltransferase RlmH [Ostreibacterium oceani]|uniref:23S rRNA (pseudouridine(1915)-N(3))-methyltransferase RlmH n=1 Tax=Ostreibacterium oceani TaxID=2654998 RepID=UPI00128C2A79|nr:23S rRNA (pseudouridine(1915)-N(3))-methyltransferase RlmH [Ostreibacterium oceani]